MLVALHVLVPLFAVIDVDYGDLINFRVLDVFVVVVEDGVSFDRGLRRNGTAPRIVLLPQPLNVVLLGDVVSETVPHDDPFTYC